MTDLEEVFRLSVEEYLNAAQPQYVLSQLKFPLVEHEIQGFYLAKLLTSGLRVRVEGKYPNVRKRYDLFVESRQHTYIEIEWYAQRRDCFGAKAFDDLDKLLKYTPRGASGLFLAVNISDKFQESAFPKRPKHCTDFASLPLRHRKQSGLARLFKRGEDEDNLGAILTNVNMWYWRYPHSREDFNVLVFSCMATHRKRWQ